MLVALSQLLWKVSIYPLFITDRLIAAFERPLKIFKAKIDKSINPIHIIHACIKPVQTTAMYPPIDT